MEEIVKTFLHNQYPNTQVAIGYVKNRKSYFKGLLKTKAEVVEIDNADSLFEIGSITKVFTTYLLAQLLVEKKITGAAVLSKYLPKECSVLANITLKSLANHTSGLPRLPDNFYTIKNYNARNPYLQYDEAALLDYLENYLPLIAKKTNPFEYSNLGSMVLSYALSKITKATFQELVKDKIFQPLDMKDSTFDRNQKKNSVVGLNKEGTSADYWEGGPLSGCIGIVSSAKDMVKFVHHMLDTKNEISKLSFQETHQIEDRHAIGLGWGIRTLADGSKSYNHGGGSDGYSCYMKLHSASQSGVIVLTNISAFNEQQSQINELTSAVLDYVRSLD